MRKIIKRGAILAVVLFAVVALAAPVRAEMPVTWINDLIAWYLEQNGVNIVLAFPGTGTNSNTGPQGPTLEVIAGNNQHYLWRPMTYTTTLNNYENDNGYYPTSRYDQHTGTLFGAGSDIHYNFTQWVFPMWLSPFTFFCYTNGQVSSTLAFPVQGDPMCGQAAWMDHQSGLGQGTAAMKITFDFYYNGWRYGGVINNKVSGIGCAEDSPPTGPWWVFTGTYSGIRTNVLGPLLRSCYIKKGNGTNGIIINDRNHVVP